ncbi:MAG: hypothetical protein HS114_38150 [Anaerolineales bacterium]|nr:hypothetical protein [Anaerolineales bacterium]
MQTFTRTAFHIGLALRLIVPGPVGRTALHRGENMTNPGCAPLPQDGLDAVFFAKCLALADELNLDLVLHRDGLRSLSNFIPQRDGKLTIVKMRRL